MTYQIYGKGAKQILIWEKATTIEYKKDSVIKKCTLSQPVYAQPARDTHRQCYLSKTGFAMSASDSETTLDFLILVSNIFIYFITKYSECF
jgi:hypothetical protein